MMGLTTGRYSIIRGSVVNEYGDEVDGDTVVQADVLGSIIEKTRTDFDPANNRVSTLRYLVGRFNHRTHIEDGDRIRDEKTGETFVVNSVSRPSNVIHKSDTVVDLSRI